MYFGVIMLMIIVLVLSAASLQGVLKFRKLTKSIRDRSAELPAVAELGHRVDDLDDELWKLSNQPEKSSRRHEFLPLNSSATSPKLALTLQLKDVERALDSYQVILESREARDPRIADNEEELDLVDEFRRGLYDIETVIQDHDDFNQSFSASFVALEMRISELQRLATQLPVSMQKRMEKFSLDARTEYHTWITLSIVFGLAAIAMIWFLATRFHARIIKPLELLIEGSRQVACGNFDYRIDLKSDDEVAELADALNAMTRNFQSIKSDLNRQVQQRTKEVVRSEKMASVGFLAAGVAHEINNPLASIAWSAESLEMRLNDILETAGLYSEETSDDIQEMQKYLRRIQEEAFRCKGITAGLLDFSRMGDVQKTSTNLSEIIESVIEMVRPLSKYRERNIVFNADHSVNCIVNAQEMKQVFLNLITNALGSVEIAGTVTIDLEQIGDNAELRIADDGCGMTEEIKQHLFEPFFTRRRDGQGTGLGLSITYQIIEDHGGRITPFSEGPGKGSTFTVVLPSVGNDQKNIVRNLAA
jgi:signal transduction histidine kinase